MVMFYALHVVSVLYSSNLQYAFFDLQVKLPFLILPFVLSSVTLREDELRKVKQAFIYGCAFASLYCIMYAFDKFVETSDASVFFYETFSKFLHPTYFAILLNLAILIAFDEWLKNKNMKRSVKRLLAVSLPLNLVAVVLLMSRTALVVFVLTAVIMVVILLKQKITVAKLKWIVGGAVLFIAVIAFSMNKFNRFAVVESTVSSLAGGGSYADDKKGANGFLTRIYIWKEAIKLICEHPVVGVGCGDIKDELVKQYVKDDYALGVERRFNPHSQYLHTTVSLGIIGLLSLCAMLFLPLFYSIKHRDWVYVIFLLVIILNSLTESILERQAGILFFVFFNCLFYLQLKQSSEKPAQKQETQALA